MAQPDVSIREFEYKVPVLNQQDLDRNFALPTTHLFKWMQAARMDLPWMQRGYRGLGLVEPVMPSRRLLVASQMVRTLHPDVLTDACDHEVTTKVEIGDVGKTSIEFRYKIFYDTTMVATGTTTMVVAAGEPGKLKPSPVPEAIKNLASSEPGADKIFLMESLNSQPKEAPKDAYVVPLVIRWSDEDVNKHANHSAIPRYFEDAKESIIADPTAPAALREAAVQKLCAVLVNYASEARAQDKCEVRLSLGEKPGVLNVWVVRLAENKWGGKPGLIGRGQMLVGGGPMPDSEVTRIKLVGPSKL
mmetsp:Transcript_51637/g.109720  ORF Transcript_51637/g.109720 Transcript_51637/m.109720 type:complete len:303 (-) Transcript_51637:147-1055(-)